MHALCEIYGVNLRIQSGSGKIPTRKNSVFGHFSRCDRKLIFFSVVVTLSGKNVFPPSTENNVVFSKNL